MKKFLSLALALLMILGSTVAIFADDAVVTSAEASPYKNAIDTLKALDVFKGNGEGDGAEDPIERYQMALFIARALTGETDDSYWATANLTPFADIVDGYTQYAGAITYAYQRQIILGVSDTAYAPAEGIIYQDALTMATRALGYVGLEYPWGNIRKAEALGITAGIENVGFEDALTRGEVAQIIYNMLSAKTADGRTLLTDVFGVQIVVITATNDNKYAWDDKTLSDLRDGYVSFMKLSDVNLYDESNTTVGKIYSLPASAFGLEPETTYVWKDGEAVAKESYDYAVGYSFFVSTKDNFKTLNYAEACSNEILWNLGHGEDAEDQIAIEKGLLAVSGNAYEMVKEYTDLHNAQGTWNGRDEIMVFVPYSVAEVTESNGLYYKDWFGNILDKKTGEIVARYLPHDGNYYVVEEIKDKDGEVIKEVYRLATDKELAEWSLGYKEYTINGGFGLVTNPATISNDDAYASLEVIDDNNDGEYDRAFFKAYSFGYYNEYKDNDGKWHAQFFKYDGATYKSMPTTKVFNEFLKDVEYSGEYAADFADGVYTDGAWVIGYWNAQTNNFEVIKVLEEEYATLNTWNVSKRTVTLDGAAKSIGYADLSGDMFRGIGDDNKANAVAAGDYFYGLYRKLVKYIELDGKVIYIAEAAKVTNGVVVIDQVVGVTSDGMIEAYAYSTDYVGNKLIKIKTIDNWYFGFNSFLFFDRDNYQNNPILKYFADPIFAVASIDTEGNYNLLTDYTANPATLTYTKYGYGYFNAEVTTQNGKYTAHTANADSYYIFVVDESDNDGFINNHFIFTSQGIPATDATVSGDFVWVSGSHVIVADVDNYQGFDTAKTVGAFYVPTTASYTNAGWNGDSIFTNHYTYFGLYDVVNGAYVDNTVINEKLEKGMFYIVLDGKVVFGTDDITNLAYMYRTSVKADSIDAGIFEFTAGANEEANIAAIKAAVAADNDFDNAVNTIIIDNPVATVIDGSVSAWNLAKLDEGSTYTAVGFYNIANKKLVIYKAGTVADAVVTGPITVKYFEDGVQAEIETYGDDVKVELNKHDSNKLDCINFTITPGSNMDWAAPNELSATVTYKMTSGKTVTVDVDRIDIINVDETKAEVHVVLADNIDAIANAAFTLTIDLTTNHS